MSRPTRAFLLLLAIAGAVAYGLLDVRRRSGLDPAAESTWRETLDKVEIPSVARHRTDATVYFAAALALERGSDPYAAKSPRGWRYVYPPLFAILVRPLAHLPVADGAFVLFVVNALALAASAWLLVRILGPPRSFRAVAIALLLASPFLVQTFQRGQVTILLLLTQVGALALLLRGRDFAAGIVLALGVALRLTPLLVAAMVLAATVRSQVKNPQDRPLRPSSRALRFTGGLVSGMVLWFGLLPAAILGPERALDVSQRWLDSTERLYASAPGAMADLTTEYAIDEGSFKNQSVRRVWGDSAALVAAIAAVGVAALLGFTRMRDRGAPAFVRAFGIGVFLPVLVTRYAWPTHYVAAIPFLAACLAGKRRPWSVACVVVLAAGTVLFYLGHLRGLNALPEAGVLLVAAALAVAIALRIEAGTGPRDELLLDRYPDASVLRGAYRRARLRHGKFRALASLFPREGVIVDLGSGEGLFAHVLVEESSARQVVAVDHDVRRAARLRESAEGLRIMAPVAPIERIPLPPCEGVAAVDVLHYLDGAAQDALLARVHAALKPGGVFVLRDPDAARGLRFRLTRLHERIATGLGFTRASIGRYRSVAEWIVALQKAGFTSFEGRPPPLLSPYADYTIVARKVS